MSAFANILVATDFSDRAVAGLEEAGTLARRLESRVDVLFVVEDHLPPILMFTSEKERQVILKRHALEAIPRLKEEADRHLSGCSVNTVTAVGSAAVEIVRHARAADVDLIVMASHGYGPIRQVLLGSTTERVLHRAPCPVLVVPSEPRHQPA